MDKVTIDNRKQNSNKVDDRTLGLLPEIIEKKKLSFGKIQESLCKLYQLKDNFKQFYIFYESGISEPKDLNSILEYIKYSDGSYNKGKINFIKNIKAETFFKCSTELKDYNGFSLKFESRFDGNENNNEIELPLSAIAGYNIISSSKEIIFSQIIINLIENTNILFNTDILNDLHSRNLIINFLKDINNSTITIGKKFAIEIKKDNSIRCTLDISEKDYFRIEFGAINNEVSLEYLNEHYDTDSIMVKVDIKQIAEISEIIKQNIKDTYNLRKNLKSKLDSIKMHKEKFKGIVSRVNDFNNDNFGKSSKIYSWYDYNDIEDGSENCNYKNNYKIIFNIDERPIKFILKNGDNVIQSVDYTDGEFGIPEAIKHSLNLDFIKKYHNSLHDLAPSPQNKNTMGKFFKIATKLTDIKTHFDSSSI